MQKYFVSNYVKSIPFEDRCLLFNGINGSMDEVSGDLGQLLENRGVPLNNESFGEEEIEFLLRRGHITVLTAEAEKERFIQYAAKIDAAKMKRCRKGGTLMFLLSYTCNLDCYYCYQKEVRHRGFNEYMKGSFIEEFFDKYYPVLFKETQEEEVDFCLYGGEPLLPRNREAVEAVLKYAEKHSTKVSAISNGIALEHFLDLLGPLPGQINQIQISLDGDQETHDCSRIGKDGQPTFDKIIHSIHSILDRKTKLQLRINIEQNGIGKLGKLVQMLDEQEILSHPYTHFYIHPLHNNQLQTDDSSFLNCSEVTNEIRQLGFKDKIIHPVKRKCNEIQYLTQLTDGLGLSHTRFCMQCMPNSYILDPFGDLYACYEEAGQKAYAIGHVGEGKIEEYPIKKAFLEKGVQNQQECMKCTYALLCGGDCGCKNRTKSGSILNPECSERKDLMTEAVKEMYLNKKKFAGFEQEFIASQLSKPNL